MAVTLIKVFYVHSSKEAEFVSWWKEVKEDITRQPGFISGKFHKSLRPESRFNFINIALWENEDIYWKAYEKSVGPMKAALQNMGVEMTPAHDWLSASALYSRASNPAFPAFGLVKPCLAFCRVIT